MKLKLYEGLGGYAGKPGPNSKLHPNGRLGALLVLEDDAGNVLYQTKNASTLPDGITQKYADKVNHEIAVLAQGTYQLYTRQHQGKSSKKYRAFNVRVKGSGTVPCVRRTLITTATGINVHYRSQNDDQRTVLSYIWSLGCITVLQSDMDALRTAMGLTKQSDFSNAHYFCDIEINRDNMPTDVKAYLVKVCGEEAAGTLFGKSAEDVEAERKAGAIAAYKNLIQEYCKFSNPDAVWKQMDAHPYAESLYRKWANSYITELND